MIDDKKVKNDKLKSYFTEEDDQLSLVRTDWFSDFLAENLSINTVRKNTFKILDVGCGNGKLLYNLKRIGFIDIYGCDYSTLSKEKSQSMRAYRSINLNTESLRDIYDKRSFDLVCCTEVLEHLFDPEKTLVELIDLTKKDAYLFIYYSSIRPQYFSKNKIFIWKRCPQSIYSWNSYKIFYAGYFH